MKTQFLFNGNSQNLMTQALLKRDIGTGNFDIKNISKNCAYFYRNLKLFKTAIFG